MLTVSSEDSLNYSTESCKVNLIIYFNCILLENAAYVHGKPATFSLQLIHTKDHIQAINLLMNFSLNLKVIATTEFYVVSVFCLKLSFRSIKQSSTLYLSKIYRRKSCFISTFNFRLKMRCKPRWGGPSYQMVVGSVLQSTGYDLHV